MSGSVLLPDCCRTLGKDHALAAAGGQLATRPNHTFQFLPQLLNAVSPVVVLEEISVLQVCDLAQHPKIELLPVKANDLGADLVEVSVVPGHGRTLLWNVKKGGPRFRQTARRATLDRAY